MNSQTGRIGAWVVAIGVVVSVCLVYCFAMLPSLFTLSFVDKEDLNMDESYKKEDMDHMGFVVVVVVVVVVIRRMGMRIYKRTSIVRTSIKRTMFLLTNHNIYI